MKALEEMSVLSPLRLCGITKVEVRKHSKEAGLFTHDKPAYACLATRIPTGTAITAEALRTVESAEKILFDLGFTDFRVRLEEGRRARLEINKAQAEKLLHERAAIIEGLKPYFDKIVLDLNLR
jgi:uncharacterized protein